MSNVEVIMTELNRFRICFSEQGFVRLQKASSLTVAIQSVATLDRSKLALGYVLFE